MVDKDKDMSFNQRDVEEVKQYGYHLIEKNYIKYQNLGDEVIEIAKRLEDIVHKANEIYEEAGF